MASLTEILAPTISADATHNSMTATFSQSANVGDFVVVCVINSTNGTQTAATDSVGNTYINGQTVRDSVTTFRLYIWTTIVTKAIVGGSSTLTCHLGGNAWYGMSASKITSPIIGGIGAIDNSAANSSQSTATPNTGASGVQSQANDIAIAMYGWVGTATYAEPTSYTNPHGAGVILTAATPGINAAVSYQQLTATTTQNPTCTLSASSASAGMIFTYNTTTIFSQPFNPNAGAKIRPAAFKPGLAR